MDLICELLFEQGAIIDDERVFVKTGFGFAASRTLATKVRAMIKRLVKIKNSKLDHKEVIAEMMKEKMFSTEELAKKALKATYIDAKHLWESWFNETF